MIIEHLPLSHYFCDIGEVRLVKSRCRGRLCCNKTQDQPWFGLDHKIESVRMLRSCRLLYIHSGKRAGNKTKVFYSKVTPAM